MTNRMKILIGAGILACGVAGTASAMPLAPVHQGTVPALNVEEARLICPPYRPCYRVYGGGYPAYGYGYRPYRYGYGYRRPFRRYGYY